MAINSKKFWNNVWENGNDRYYEHFNFIISQLPEKGTIVDIGCGIGTLLSLIKKQKPKLKLLGVEHSIKAINRLRKRGISGKLGTLPNVLKTIHCDIMIATEVLEHMIDDMSVLQYMANSAKKIIITVPNDRLGPDECSEHERKYTDKTLAQKLDKYFKKYEIYDANGYLLAIAWN